MLSLVSIVLLAACDQTAQPGDTGGPICLCDSGPSLLDAARANDAGPSDEDAPLADEDAPLAVDAFVALDAHEASDAFEPVDDDAGFEGDAGSIGVGECSITSECLMIMCLRPIRCVKECGGPAAECGCCPCAVGSFDSITCGAAG